MPNFSFIGYTLTELFSKRQIYKQMSSTFYASNDAPTKKLLGRRNKAMKRLFNYF